MFVIKRKVKEDSTIYQISQQSSPEGWYSIFTDPEIKSGFKLVSDIIGNSEYYPLKKNLFKAFELVKPNDVKVIIMGQDPYPDLVNINNSMVPRAQGMSFSVDKEDCIPASLKNIFKELTQEYPGEFYANHGDLSNWVKQGVFLLNYSLTFNPNDPESYMEIWKGIVINIIKKLLYFNPNIILVLWGRKSQKIKSYISANNILEALHPSSRNLHGGFLGCNHFIKINEILKSQGKEEINWCID